MPSKSTCSVDECARVCEKRGMCNMHYKRQKKTGSTDTPLCSFPAKERFLAYVSKSDGCWEWQGSTGKFGYGWFWFQGGPKESHRVSWQLHIGEIPPRMFVLHRCDNPPCVRPDHLFLGDHRANSDDMIAKGRAVHFKGSALPTAKLHEDIIPAIRRLRASGMTYQSIASAYGVCRSTVSYACRGKSWKHVNTQGG